MKAYQKGVPSIVLELTESEAKALAAIIGTMGSEQLDQVEKNALEDDYVDALKKQRESNSAFACQFYCQLGKVLNK